MALFIHEILGLVTGVTMSLVIFTIPMPSMLLYPPLLSSRVVFGGYDEILQFVNRRLVVYQPYFLNTLHPLNIRMKVQWYISTHLPFLYMTSFPCFLDFGRKVVFHNIIQSSPQFIPYLLTWLLQRGPAAWLLRHPPNKIIVGNNIK